MQLLASSQGGIYLNLSIIQPSGLAVKAHRTPVRGAHLLGSRLPSSIMSEATVSVSISVQGMSCEHCRSSVVKGLHTIDGVKSVALELSSGNGSVEVVEARAAVLRDTVKLKVEELGYSVQLA